MRQIVCRVVGESNRLSFKWSDGAGEFKPYELADTPLSKFQQSADECRKHLGDIVQHYLEWVQGKGRDSEKEHETNLRRSCLALAQAGNKLYERLFRPN